MLVQPWAGGVPCAVTPTYVGPCAMPAPSPGRRSWGCPVLCQSWKPFSPWQPFTGETFLPFSSTEVMVLAPEGSEWHRVPRPGAQPTFPTGRPDSAGSCGRSLAWYVCAGWQGGVPRARGPRSNRLFPVPSPAGPCSAAWLLCGRRGSGGKRRRRSTACTTTASAVATVANSALTSMTPRRWPCVPGIA